MKEIIREPAAFCGGMQDKLIQALFHICAAAGQCTISRFRTWKPDIRIRSGRGKDRVFVSSTALLAKRSLLQEILFYYLLNFTGVDTVLRGVSRHNQLISEHKARIKVKSKLPLCLPDIFLRCQQSQMLPDDQLAGFS